MGTLRRYCGFVAMTDLIAESKSDNLLGSPSKNCYACNQKKSLDQFNTHKAMADGHLNICKKCHYARSKARRLADPTIRLTERESLRKRRGTMTREEYFAARKRKAKGRKITINAYAQRRRAKIEQTELSEIDIFAIEEAYRLRELRRLVFQFDWHVDHIVPLSHKKACGLHNANNLQVVPAAWNMAKKHTNMNKYLGI